LSKFSEILTKFYVVKRQGVEELDPEKLPQLIELRYQTVTDAMAKLGDPSNIRAILVGFQKYLYQ